MLKSRELRRLVLASHDDRLLTRLRDVVSPFGVEVVSLTDIGRPEPIGSPRDALLSARIKAAVVAAETGLPTLGHARYFHIDPLLRWGGGGPQWSWQIPWPNGGEDLADQLAQARFALDASGYCGPDDRGAYFQTVLCLVWPDAEAQIFEGRIEGQFGVWGRFPTRGDLIEDYFVPDGEAVALACLTDEVRQLYSDQARALEALRGAFSTPPIS